MLTQGEDVEAHVLKQRGWSISAIARHVERDRKTVRSYLNGERQPGVRVDGRWLDPLGEFEGYIRARFVDDPHCGRRRCSLRSPVLGYVWSYPTSCARSASVGCGPHCEACRGLEGARHDRDRAPAG